MASRRLNILLTGLGSPSAWGTWYSLKDSNFRLFGCDIKQASRIPLSKNVEVFHRTLDPETPQYPDHINYLCRSLGIDLIIPQTTRELVVLSNLQKHCPLLTRDEKIVPKVLCAKSMYVRIANNKHDVIRVAESVGVPAPKTIYVQAKADLIRAVNEIGLPAVMKPLMGFGGRGVRVIKQFDFSDIQGKDTKSVSFDLLKRIMPDCLDKPIIVQEYLPGDEYTVDVFRPKPPILCVAIPRQRVEVKNGISHIARVDMGRSEIIGYSKKLAEGLGLIYCFGFQFKEDKNGIPKLIECNPRVQGGMVVSTLAGFNMIEKSVCNALDLPWNADDKIFDIECVRNSGWQANTLK